MLLLLALMQTVDADEVTTPSRLFAKPACRRGVSDDEILVCGDGHSPYRIARTAPRPDPTTVDRRPKVKVADGWCLRVGFMISLSGC